MLAAVPDLPAVEVPTTQPAITAATQGAAMLFLLVIAAGVTGFAWWFGAFRRGIDGPRRVDAGAAWVPAAAFGAAIVAFLAVSIVLVALGVIDPEADQADLPLRRLLIVNGLTFLVPALAAVATAAVLTRVLGQGVRLGLGGGELMRAGPVAFVALLVILPWMLAAGVVLQMVRDALGLEVQQAHQLLKELPQADAGTFALILFTALAVAPFAEEVLFRGVIQTSLAAGLGRLVLRREGFPRPAGFSRQSPRPLKRADRGDQGTQILDYETAPDVPTPGPAARWVAILLSAALFAALHEPWSIPLIFLLAVALGYLYERTGNLWAAVLAHFGFNAFNTLLALAAGVGR